MTAQFTNPFLLQLDNKLMVGKVAIEMLHGTSESSASCSSPKEGQLLWLKARHQVSAWAAH